MSLFSIEWVLSDNLKHLCRSLYLEIQFIQKQVWMQMIILVQVSSFSWFLDLVS